MLHTGFRPFFLLAGGYAVIAMALWLYDQSTGLTLNTHYGPWLWHSHEMLFGYAAAVIAGFLLTAIPNWTGLPTVSGAALGALVALWLAGRLLAFWPDLVPTLAITVINLAFWPALAGALARPLVRSGQRRNLIFVLLPALMLFADLAVHAQAAGWTQSGAQAGVELMLFVVVLVITVIGGRVIPFFAERALTPNTVHRRPRLDIACIAGVIVTYFTLIAARGTGALAVVAATVALLHGIRLWGWWTQGVAKNPLLWILYTGYAWVVAGFALTALSAGGWIPLAGAVHAFAAGAIGSLTLGMMARVALGHTGRPLAAPVSMTTAFVLINLAAAVRVIATGIGTDGYGTAILLSGGLWCAAFTLFMIHFAPILVAPRYEAR